MFSAYLFAGIAMLFWGIAPIFGKLGLGSTQPLIALTIRSFIISIILLITVTVSGQWENILRITSKDATYIAFEGICAALLGQLAYYYALKYGDVSQISPLVAAFPLIALLLSIMVLGEKITLCKVAASFLIAGGVVLLRY